MTVKYVRMVKERLPPPVLQEVSNTLTKYQRVFFFCMCVIQNQLNHIKFCALDPFRFQTISLTLLLYSQEKDQETPLVV